jgi:hypothetical protein
MRELLFSLALLGNFVSGIGSQTIHRDTITLQWQATYKEQENGTQLSIRASGVESSDDGLPYLLYRLPSASFWETPSFTVLEWEDLPVQTKNAPELDNSYRQNYRSYKVRNEQHNEFRIPLLQEADGKLQIARKIAISGISGSTQAENAREKSGSANEKSWPLNSVLASGNWFKIGTTEDEVYRVDYEFLRQNNVVNAPVNSQTLRLFGNGGGRVPEANAAWRPQDLQEVGIWVEDGGDGLFGPGDFFLFFGESPHSWIRNQQTYEFQRNIYADTVYYFFGIGGNGLRISNSGAPLGNPDYVTTNYSENAIHEDERFNLTKSGREWYGELFSFQNSHTVSLSLRNPVIGGAVSVRARFAARCTGCNTLFRAEFGSQLIGEISIGPVDPCYSCVYFRPNILTGSFTAGGSNAAIRLTRVSPQTGGEDRSGWLDFIELNYRANLAFSGSTFTFRDINASGLSEFRIAGSGDLSVWDIRQRGRPENLSVQNGNGYRFVRALQDSIGEFVAFSPLGRPAPRFMGRVPNQDLHGLIQSEPVPDMVIVVHPSLRSAAQELADFHLEREGIISHIVTTPQVFNEFGSGKADVSAIRDFFHLYYKVHGPENAPRYALLFGDGSYDYKPYLNRSGSVNSNLVPAFQTTESASRSGQSHPSDYFFVNFSNGNLPGTVRSNDPIFMGIGRIPASNLQEARDVVGKIKHYVQEAACMRDWRNNVTLFADDMDAFWERQFVDFNEDLFHMLDTVNPAINVDKVYIDAFVQTSSAGQRYPEANRYLNQRINRGTLFLNFIGHGGEQGLTSERVLQIDDIESWTNLNNLPFFSTATCTFTRFDDPEFVSAGERILLRPDRGGIGLMSTTRAITVVPEFQTKLFKATFGSDYGNFSSRRLGDIQMLARKCPCNAGEQNIMLFADPAMRLAFPENLVLTDSLNGVYVGGENFDIDTLQATDIVRITGHIADRDSQLISGFSGTLYITVFDKPLELSTLANDPAAIPIPFTLQNSVIFRGKVSVQQGKWNLEFKVPLDINYRLGPGKISYYAENSMTDAHGYFRDFLIGGSSGNCDNDTKGPEISLYLNDENFREDGIAHNSPVLLIRLADESGINTAGAGIGHNLQLVLNGDRNNPIVLNDFYEADLNTFKSGTVRFPLPRLNSGFHSIEVEVWDGCNNLSRETLRFTVTNEEPALIAVQAYPNPFHESTRITFQHNQAERPVKLEMQIFDLMGSAVKSFYWEGSPSGFQNITFTWDGTNNGGSHAGSGTYIARIKMQTESGQTKFGSTRIISIP